MARFISIVLLVALCSSDLKSQEFQEQYSARIGFYASRKGLNNGLILGADGLLDFYDYDASLMFSGDCYIKQSFEFFRDPKPDIVKQQILLIPVGVSVTYHLMKPAVGKMVLSIGGGVGYYFDFYTLDYRDSPGPPAMKTQSASNVGGSLFSSAVARIALNNFFLEPKVLFAKAHTETVGSYLYEINPSGFVITIGFQY